MRIESEIKVYHKDIIPFEKRKIGEDKNGKGIYRNYVNGVLWRLHDIKSKAQELLRWPNRIESRYISGLENLKFAASLLLVGKTGKKNAADPIQIKVSKNGYNNCFYYLTNEGAWDDFSYKKAITTEFSFVGEYIRKAFRHAIDDQITGFRNRSSYYGNKQVDHQFPHEALLQTFLNRKGIRLEEVETERIDGHRWSPVALKDKNLSKEWQEFHLKNCALDMKASYVLVTLVTDQKGFDEG